MGKLWPPAEEILPQRPRFENHPRANVNSNMKANSSWGFISCQQRGESCWEDSDCCAEYECTNSSRASSAVKEQFPGKDDAEKHQQGSLFRDDTVAIYQQKMPGHTAPPAQAGQCQDIATGFDYGEGTREATAGGHHT